MLQDEKFRTERDAKEREALVWQKTDSMQGDLRAINDSLSAKQREAKDIDAEIYAYKGLLEDKGAEVARLRKELAQRQDENLVLAKQRRNAETDVLSLSASKKAAESDADHLAAINDKLMNEKAEAEARERDSAVEAAGLRRQVDELEAKVALARKEKDQRAAELDVVLDTKKSGLDEADRLASFNSKLQAENQDLSNMAKDTEIQLMKAKQKYEDSLALLDAKEKELARARSGLSYTENRSTGAGAELYKLKQDNETLQRLLDSYRKDVDFQKKLREIESGKKMELELEKRRLENEALSKDIEARTAKKELEKVKDSHDMLLDSRLQMNEELSAMKEHADLLESQNFSVLPTNNLVS